MLARIIHTRSKLTVSAALLAAVTALTSCSVLLKQSDSGITRGDAPASEYASGRVARKSSSRGVSTPTTSDKEKPAQKRLVIYSGELRISTPDIEDAAQKARSMAESLGGRVQHTQRSRFRRTARIVVRVPVKKFQQALEMFAGLGRVTSRRVSARDVTREFQDTAARLASARRVRERLYVLMRAQADVDERIKILREINRLTARIEGITARLKYLKDRASMSTITILLSGRGSENLTSFGASPFAWIRSLHPARRGIKKTRWFSMTKPVGFFDFRDKFYDGESNHAFASPDGTRIRVGVMENYPRGDLKFWARALELELGRRGYEVARSNPALGKAASVLFECKARDGFQLIHYSVQLIVDADHIQVLEVVYPSTAARKKYAPAVEKALKTYELRTDALARFMRMIRLAP